MDETCSAEGGTSAKVAQVYAEAQFGLCFSLCKDIWYVIVFPLYQAYTKIGTVIRHVVVLNVHAYRYVKGYYRTNSGITFE